MEIVECILLVDSQLEDEWIEKNVDFSKSVDFDVVMNVEDLIETIVNVCKSF